MSTIKTTAEYINEQIAKFLKSEMTIDVKYNDESIDIEILIGGAVIDTQEIFLDVNNG